MKNTEENVRMVSEFTHLCEEVRAFDKVCDHYYDFGKLNENDDRDDIFEMLYLESVASMLPHMRAVIEWFDENWHPEG